MICNVSFDIGVREGCDSYVVVWDGFINYIELKWYIRVGELI